MNENVTGHLREKKGLFYVVVNYYTEGGERKQKWFSTKLPIRGNKKNAEAALRQILNDFEIPTSEDDIFKANTKQKIEMKDNGKVAIVKEQRTIPTEAIANIPLEKIPKEQVQFMLFADYLVKYVPLTRKRKRE